MLQNYLTESKDFTTLVLGFGFFLFLHKCMG